MRTNTLRKILLLNRTKLNFQNTVWILKEIFQKKKAIMRRIQM